MTAHDRTPAPPLDESDLARIVTHPTCGQCGQAWSLRACGPTHALIAHERQAIVPALIAALRAAWRENARYRAALTHYADEENWGLHPDFLENSPHDWYMPDRAGYETARAALAAPGAGDQATEERTT